MHLTNDEKFTYAELLFLRKKKQINPAHREHVKECSECGNGIRKEMIKLSSRKRQGISKDKKTLRREYFYAALITGLIIIAASVYFIFFNPHKGSNVIDEIRNGKPVVEDTIVAE